MQCLTYNNTVAIKELTEELKELIQLIKEGRA